MPLSKPAPRKHLHTRAITYQGYKREDGLWDIEGHLIDTKTYSIDNKWRDKITVGEALHEMLIRVTIDDNFLIKDIEAVTDNSPFEMCPNITPNYKALIGLSMGLGWRKIIRQKVGGVAGCTHITELLFPMATVAIQTLMPFRKNIERSETSGHEKSKLERPFVLNTCHAWATDSVVVKENEPAFYTGPEVSDIKK
ncbi:MAG: hypothetical protein COA71_11500 [SAR86 cluster bacterium]|uniref:DUF2889 domain-containing protein n=1 Tax=SAR86 cluster bacterium TaxID=2030880 RepID=A0A2A5C9L0_9GAMM|nr:DUF2889 domain-containing protein [Gammaproteobacteria bacterium AH-315-E17]PCJ40130.1 MAG: hypothetical protein COA71_11500 [SAR86 cluster bacterium]